MDGTINHTVDGYELRFERSLNHPVDIVWAAITEPERRAAWFFSGTIELIEGGAVDLQDSAHGITGVVTAIEAPTLLEFTWSSLDAPTSTVRFELEGSEAGCVLRFTHTVDRTAHPENLMPGWHCIFEDLPLHLEGNPVANVPGRFQAHKERYRARFVAPS